MKKFYEIFLLMVFFISVSIISTPDPGVTVLAAEAILLINLDMANMLEI